MGPSRAGSAPPASAALPGQVRSTSRTWLLTALVFVIAALGMGTASLEVVRSDQQHAVDSAQLTATLSAGTLENYVRARSLAAEVVRRGIQDGTLKGEAQFLQGTRHIREQFGGYFAINFVDDRGVIRLASAKDTSRSVKGKSILDHSEAAPVLRAVMRDRRPRATGPLTLFQGNRGVATYTPVGQEPSTGYINVVFDATTLVERCFGDRLLDAEALRLTDQGAVIYESHGFESSQGVSATAGLDVLDRHWDLEMRSRRASISEQGHPWIHALALLVAVGIALVVNLTLRRAAERVRDERVRRELAERVQGVGKLEALGQLAGGVAHDFNNLLTVVASNLELLRDHPSRTEAELLALDEIATAAQRGGELTGQLLAFSRKQVVMPRPVDVDVAVMRANTMLRRVLREDIKLQVDLGADHKWVVIDPGQLDRALLNLALNAADAMPQGGALTLRTRALEDQVCVEVEDDGAGMPPEVAAHVFEPFFTTKPVGKGTGLGLATVYGVVTQAGGEVKLESELGQGTCFRILLPQTNEQPASGPHVTSRTRMATVGGRKVLLVEDDPAVRRGAARTLRRAGYSVVEAGGGEEALGLFDDQVDILATDAVMPGMGGRELIEALRERRPTLAVVLMSGHAPDVLGDTLERLNVEYLPKPYSAEQLSEALVLAVQRQAAKRGKAS